KRRPRTALRPRHRQAHLGPAWAGRRIAHRRARDRGLGPAARGQAAANARPAREQTGAVSSRKGAAGRGRLAMNEPPPVDAVLSEDRLFWSLIDAPGVRSTGPLPESLIAELADDLPVPVETVFAVAAPTGDGRLLVCAAVREQLQGLPEG